MKLDSIRLNASARNQLVSLRRKTGIENWNVLCRWAFCLSLSEGTLPRKEYGKGASGVEMTWKTFAGIHEGAYLALLKTFCYKHGIPMNSNSLNEQCRLHIQRGIAYLSGRGRINNILDLVELASTEVLK